LSGCCRQRPGSGRTVSRLSRHRHRGRWSVHYLAGKASSVSAAWCRSLRFRWQKEGDLPASGDRDQDSPSAAQWPAGLGRQKRAPMTIRFPRCLAHGVFQLGPTDKLKLRQFYNDDLTRVITVFERRTRGQRSIEPPLQGLATSRSCAASVLVTWTQTLGDWLGAHTRGLAPIGGVPRVIVPTTRLVS
jgi:hypothetical protein